MTHITYELAKKLREHGFPLRKCHGAPDWKGEAIFKIYNDAYFFPTLPELIKECASAMVISIDVDGNAYAFHYMDDNRKAEGRGKTPEEAVALLYLSLNPKRT